KGKLVNGLLKDDFVVLEDGVEQQVQQFSNEPAPLSVAVIINTGIGGTALRRFASSIVSLSSAFINDFDEAAVYRYNTTIRKLADFSKNQKSFENSLDVVRRIADNKGDTTEQPLLILPGRGPRWLRWILDRGARPTLMNDAVFAAAKDLEQRS